MSAPGAAADWERRFREEVAAGRSPDALSRYSHDEAERFWSRTVPGPDGHTYWIGGKEFRRNDGSHVVPRRWVWRNTHGPIPARRMVYTTCGEPRCVTLGHLAAEDRSGRQFTDEQLIGAGQVAALRRGRAPSLRWWEKHVKSPNRKTIISAMTQHSKSDYNLYEGTEVTGDADVTLIRGTVVVENGVLQVEPGFGRFVERAKFGEQLV